MSQTVSRPLRTLVFSLLLIIMAGWLLQVGKDLLIPILVALIAVYVLVATADWFGRLPVIGKWPVWARRVLVLLGFFAAAFALGGIVAVTAEQVVAAAPRYQENLMALFSRVTERFGLNQQESWEAIRAATIDKVNLQALLAGVPGSVGSLLGTITLVAIYMAFLLGERGSFARKLAVAMPEGGGEIRRVIDEINRRIGDYLAVKTLINVILGVLSWAVMWWFEVDFALFWALVIALLNYIPMWVRLWA